MTDRVRRHAVPAGHVRQIEDLLAERLARETVEVRDDEDHGGEPAISLEAWCRLAPEPVDPLEATAAQAALGDRRLDAGDPRCSHLGYDFAAGQTIASVRRRRPAPAT